MTYTWSHLTAADAPEWAELTEVLARHDDTDEVYSAEDLAEELQEHGFDPDDYLDPDDVLAAAGDGWTIVRHERRPRHISGGAGAGHHTDIVLVLARTGEDA